MVLKPGQVGKYFRSFESILLEKDGGDQLGQLCEK